MSPGTRIWVHAGPWPERIGCEGVVVAPPPDGTYPQPARGEVLILLDFDPLDATTPLTGDGEWTCVISGRSVRHV